MITVQYNRVFIKKNINAVCKEAYNKAMPTNNKMLQYQPWKSPGKRWTFHLNNAPVGLESVTLFSFSGFKSMYAHHQQGVHHMRCGTEMEEWNGWTHQFLPRCDSSEKYKTLHDYSTNYVSPCEWPIYVINRCIKMCVFHLFDYYVFIFFITVGLSFLWIHIFKIWLLISRQN